MELELHSSFVEILLRSFLHLVDPFLVHTYVNLLQGSFGLVIRSRVLCW
jgi:hypothetical protein